MHGLNGVKILCYVLFLCSVITLKSQSLVQVIPTVSPSNNVLLSDYYTGKQNAISVLLVNRDPQQMVLQTYLRITIEGQNVKLRTSSLAMSLAVDLMQGSSVQLSAAELAPYFKPMQLQGSIGFGVNQPNIFPEGYYQFCFEVLEKNTNRLLGSMECGQASISFSEGPEPVYPPQGKAVSMDQDILFQWRPQHIHQLNSEYTFTLVEIEGQEKKIPQAVFDKSKLVYETKLYSTSLPYGKEQPLLEKGKKYAWQVKVKAQNELGEEEPMANDGLSDIHWFTLK